jgi:hypothetical protein
MMSSWWLVWFVFMFFLFASPVTYGWGYRGWGPPYPRYIQRRRSKHLAASGAPAPYKHEAWGWGGDVVWMVFFVGLLWVFTALFWSPLWFR